MTDNDNQEETKDSLRNSLRAYEGEEELQISELTGCSTLL